jgi:ribosomal protein L11 methyltransferase
MSHIIYTINLQGNETDYFWQAAITELPITGLEELETVWKVYIENNEADMLLMEAFISEHKLTTIKEFVAARNWNAYWESNFETVSIENWLHIRANFHEPPTTLFEHTITITPKMSFGTGHHATTQLVLMLMRQINFKNKQVMDFGCGTAILAIMAEKLGATKVLACDYDEWCVENSEENITANNCQHIKIEKNDKPFNAGCDIVLANVNRHILIEHGDALTKATNKQGILIISGILDTDQPEMQELFEQKGFNYQNANVKNGWAAMVFEKN